MRTTLILATLALLLVTPFASALERDCEDIPSTIVSCDTFSPCPSVNDAVNIPGKCRTVDNAAIGVANAALGVLRDPPGPPGPHSPILQAIGDVAWQTWTDLRANM